MTPIRPARLQAGDEVRVIAPARSLAMIGPETREVAQQRFDEMGLTLSFGEHVEVCDEFVSSPIADRVEDLHAAFRDANVKAILTVIGGFNSNQLLPYLDWDLIRANPKIICGYSDITALSCAIWARTGLITYSGPHYSTFGMIEHFDQTLEWFRHALMDGTPQIVQPAATWSDDEWFLHQHDRQIEPNDGYWILNEGIADGTLLGGNLCTLNLLHGTEFMPDLSGTVLFLEDDYESQPHTFDRDLTSLTQQPGFESVRGVLIGRFQRASEMTRSMLTAIVRANAKLDGIPVVGNVDFGHTNPLLTVPVGGHASITASADAVSLTITH